ncbi:papilin [Aplochiton taeniatus]
MKMLVPLAILPLFLAPALMVPSSDYWESWAPYGECSRSCGSGVTVRTRRCITQRTDGGNNCVGPEKSYRTCNTQDCPDGSKDFREEQCTQFDGSDFQGKRYKWLPYYGADNPCELNCMPRGENFFYRQRSSVVDGTPCHPGRRDVCVEGVCKRMGCDNLLESTQQEDPCLQCGGNGESCYLVRKTFSPIDLPTGYNQMFIIPVGATTISIRETFPTRNYLAIKNLRGEYYLNGHWVIEFSRATPIAGTMLYYQRGVEGDSTPETVIGRGPTTEPLVFELIAQEANQGVEFEYYLPTGRSREGYYWSFGSWSVCSKECGSGYQSRLVFCAIDNEAYPEYLCASLPQPQSNRTCNPQLCPQVQSWKTGEWNVCSVTCGGGSQIRSVQCVSHDASGPRVVEDSVCAAYAEPPPTLQTCNMQRCAEYRVSSWSQCSVSCGPGEQTRTVTCVGSGGAGLDETACGNLLHPAQVRACEVAPCPRRIRWHIGDWGLCSVSCNSGLRERQVICSDRQRNLYPVEQCAVRPKPSTVETCNTQPCYSAQLVPSMPDPRGHDNTQTGFRPFLPDPPMDSRPGTLGRTNSVPDPYAPTLHCSQTYYGCCPDGRTPAGGPQGQGCPHSQGRTSCSQTSYGCCQDSVTTAQGPRREGCQEYVPPPPAPTTPLSLPTENAVECRTTTYGCCYDRRTPSSGPNGEGCPNPPNNIERTTCSLPRAAGSCSGWTARYHFDVLTFQCVHFWYGGCHGNNNNFMSLTECQRECLYSQPALDPVYTSGGASSGRSPSGGSPSGSSRTGGAAAGGSRAGGSTAGGSRSDVVPSSTAGGSAGSGPGGSGSAGGRRQGTNAASHAHRARLQLYARRPAAVAQQTYPVASLTQSGVSIDQTDPSMVEGLVGQQVVLPCRVSPPPSSTITVEWRRDGTPLSPSRHKQQPNGSILAGPLTLADSGWLLCVATRDRERDHRYIYLSVSEGPQKDPQDFVPQYEKEKPEIGSPHIQPSPKFNIDRSGSTLVEAREGQTGKISCRVTPPSALSHVKIEWTRDRQPLTSSRHTQNSEGSLEIARLVSSDSGVYTCTVSTHHQLEQRQLQLRVQADLKITTAPNNIQVSQGGTAQLPCVVSGDNVNVGWSRNGVPVRPDGRRVQTSPDGSLILNNVQPADEGSYTCNAYTGTYSVSATADVRITKASQQEEDTEFGVPPECVDQPDLANCELIVFARLCSNAYYSSFCCASCTRHAKRSTSVG